MLKELAIKYFTFFSKKDIDSLAEMLSDSVALEDWNISRSGKLAVVGAVREIFGEVNLIDVKINNICHNRNVVISELKITLDNDSLEVVDVITFDEDNLIVNINAYKK